MGSEENQDEKNIWLPEEVLPGFKDFSLKFFWKMAKCTAGILEALILSLDLTEEEAQQVRALHPGYDHQIRMLHYPPMDDTWVAENKYASRIGAHTDWRCVYSVLPSLSPRTGCTPLFPSPFTDESCSSFTLLFQDSNGGLMYFDRPSDTFIDAPPKEGVITMNIGDMFERLSNGESSDSNGGISTPRI